MNRDIELAYKSGVLGGFKDLHPDMVEFVRLIRADEREACAKVADSNLRNMQFLASNPPQSAAAYDIAIAIRARGQG